MISLALGVVVSLFRTLLRPIPPFTCFGVGLSTLDVAAAFRLCVVMRQLRELHLQSHLKIRNRINDGDEKAVDDVEPQSHVKSIAVVLVVVYGGEAIMSPWLTVQPSFMFSPVVPGLYSALTLLAESLPSVPSLSFQTEFPLSFFDGISRAFLLCQLISPVVLNHPQPVISNSPWTLILTSLIMANGGFFLVNLFSMLHPSGWSLVTPTELRAYGWTTVDLWCAPLITVLYALLTHAQPFWAEVHGLIAQFLGNRSPESEKLTAFSRGEALDIESARGICAIILAILFSSRTAWNLGRPFLKSLRGEKKKVIRSRIDGRRLKTKTQ